MNRTAPFYCEACHQIVKHPDDRVEMRVEFKKQGRATRLSNTGPIIVRKLCATHARIVYRDLERKHRPAAAKSFEDVSLPI